MQIGKSVVTVRMASIKKDGYASKLGGNVSPPSANLPSGGETGAAGAAAGAAAGTGGTGASTAGKKNLAAARGLNINLGALRPGATFIKRKSEGMSPDMSTLVLDRPAVQSGRRRKSRMHKRSTVWFAIAYFIYELNEDEASAINGKQGKRWTVMGSSSIGGVSDNEVMLKKEDDD
ncbi:hypothetical protein RFI_39326, partial [Reticulomyxa filosa]